MSFKRALSPLARRPPRPGRGRAGPGRRGAAPGRRRSAPARRPLRSVAGRDRAGRARLPDDDRVRCGRAYRERGGGRLARLAGDPQPQREPAVPQAHGPGAGHQHDGGDQPAPLRLRAHRAAPPGQARRSEPRLQPALRLSGAGRRRSPTPAEPAPAPPQDVNHAYSYQGSAEILPIRLFDDGQSTYFRFAEGVSYPAIFAVEADHSEAVVNFHVRDGYLVVDRLARGFVLRRGKDGDPHLQRRLPRRRARPVEPPAPAQEMSRSHLPPEPPSREPRQTPTRRPRSARCSSARARSARGCASRTRPGAWRWAWPSPWCWASSSSPP